MNYAEVFIGELEAAYGHLPGKYAAHIGSDGDARLTRYWDKDLPWELPVRIEETGWEKMKEITSSPHGVDFSLFLDEELYKLDEREWIEPELRLDDKGWWRLVEMRWARNDLENA